MTFLKSFTFILPILLSQLKAQNIQTYSGLFEDKIIRQNGISYGGIKGTATYEYYENATLDRIFHGKFTLKTNDFNASLITCLYKNDLKDGAWKYSSTRKDKDNTNFSLSTETEEGNYKLGQLNGTWTYNLIDKKSGKKYRYSKAQFLNNIMIGTFEFIENSTEKIDIKINYDSLGVFHGIYHVKYWLNGIPFEDKRDYNHGALISSVHRNISTGEKVSYPYSDGYGSFWTLYTALNFWGCVDNGYNGCIRHDNPIFYLAKGTVLRKDNK